NYRALPVVRDDGVRVLLTGHGGDVLLLRSATYFASWLVHGHWRALGRQLDRKRETGRGGYGYQFAAWAGFRLPPAWPQVVVHRRRYRPDRLERLMPPSIRRWYADQRPEPTRTGPDAWWLNVLDHVETFSNTPQNLFLDRLYRSFGLEPRHPY